MTNRIDAAMHSVQTARESACPNRVFADARSAQLRGRGHPVLASRELRRWVCSGDFPVHITGKSPELGFLPLPQLGDLRLCEC
jgi:hypothetical protein